MITTSEYWEPEKPTHWKRRFQMKLTAIAVALLIPAVFIGVTSKKDISTPTRASNNATESTSPKHSKSKRRPLHEEPELHATTESQTVEHSKPTRRANQEELEKMLVGRSEDEVVASIGQPAKVRQITNDFKLWTYHWDREITIEITQERVTDLYVGATCTGVVSNTQLEQ